MEKLVKCPVCGVKRLARIAMRNHIIRQAQTEVWKEKVGEKVKLKHFNYYRKKFKYVKIKKLII